MGNQSVCTSPCIHHHLHFTLYSLASSFLIIFISIFIAYRIHKNLHFIPYSNHLYIRSYTVVKILTIFVGPKEDTGKAHLKKGQLDSDCRFIMPEVNIIIMSNVLLRGSFLGQRLSENVQYLGLWEKLSSLGFKTIGARMTALKDNQAEFLLRKFDLAEKQRRAMVNRLSESNGPIFALVLIRDFALSNFWNILSK